MTKESVIDLAALDTRAACNKGAEFELLHPTTKAPIGVFFTVLGKDSDKFQALKREKADEYFRRTALAKKRGKDEEVLTMKKAEDDAMEYLLACTIGWRTGEEKTITLKGEKLEFNEFNAKKVLQNYDWIRTQIDEAIGDLELFMRKA